MASNSTDALTAHNKLILTTKEGVAHADDGSQDATDFTAALDFIAEQSKLSGGGADYTAYDVKNPDFTVQQQEMAALLMGGGNFPASIVNAPRCLLRQLLFVVCTDASADLAKFHEYKAEDGQTLSITPRARDQLTLGTLREMMLQASLSTDQDKADRDADASKKKKEGERKKRQLEAKALKEAKARFDRIPKPNPEVQEQNLSERLQLIEETHRIQIHEQVRRQAAPLRAQLTRAAQALEDTSQTWATMKHTTKALQADLFQFRRDDTDIALLVSSKDRTRAKADIKRLEDDLDVANNHSTALSTRIQMAGEICMRSAILLNMLGAAPKPPSECSDLPAPHIAHTQANLRKWTKRMRESRTQPGAQYSRRGGKRAAEEESDSDVTEKEADSEACSDEDQDRTRGKSAARKRNRKDDIPQFEWPEQDTVFGWTQSSKNCHRCLEMHKPKEGGCDNEPFTGRTLALRRLIGEVPEPPLNVLAKLYLLRQWAMARGVPEIATYDTSMRRSWMQAGAEGPKQCIRLDQLDAVRLYFNKPAA